MDSSLEELATAIKSLARVSEPTARATLEQLESRLSPEDYEHLSVLTFGRGNYIGGDVSIDGSVVGRDQVSATAQGGDAVAILNLGRIILGHDPAEAERGLIEQYLARLEGQLARLPLRGIDDQLSQGKGISMPNIYISLATTGEVELDRVRKGNLQRYYTRAALAELDDGAEAGWSLKGLRKEYDPAWALPGQAVVRSVEELAQGRAASRGAMRVLYRAQLASEAAFSNPCLVLLGDPGSGKSTFLGYLAWALARQNMGSREPRLPGWPEQTNLVPIKLSLRSLAGRLARDGQNTRTVLASLCELISDDDRGVAGTMLRAALHRGVAIVLFDGLDEVPIQGVPGQVVGRMAALQAVRGFGESYRQTRIILTCRSRAFSDELRNELGWPVATLAPLTLGQVRSFVKAWYDELVAHRRLEKARAHDLAEHLVAAISDPARPRLHAMATTPLLLTLMAVILFNNRELPRDRPMLYQRILDLLLGQWDMVRDGQSMGQALGISDWSSDQIIPLLAQLSYDAHAAASSADGRGSLLRTAVHDALLRFFENERVDDPWGTAGRCLDYINHRSGLLLPDDANDSYIFAHLTLQEHCAGRYLLIHADPVGNVMRHRDDDRWREPIMLGLGVVQQTNPFLVESVIRHLLSPDEDGKPKQIERHQRDLILAAEIGNDREWAALRRQPGLQVDELRNQLRAGLAALLADRNELLALAERVRAGFLLAELGDPRFPVTVEQWRAAIERAMNGDNTGYFCRVEEGGYIIGSSPSDPDRQDGELSQSRIVLDRPFLIGRYPITNAQWLAQPQPPTIAAAVPDAQQLGGPNQPAAVTSWYSANAYCRWLSDQLGVELRLPNEFEWEAAARGCDGRNYPWGEDWHPDRGASDENRELRGWAWTLPVGCFPAGAAPCGALDMAGNIWEWTVAPWRSHIGTGRGLADDEHRVVRGGCYTSSRINMRCAARFRNLPDKLIVNYGFRLVMAL